MGDKALPDQILACWRCRSVKLRPDDNGVDYICAACGGQICIEDVFAAPRCTEASFLLTEATWDAFVSSHELREDDQVLLCTHRERQSLQFGFRTLRELRDHISRGSQVLWSLRREKPEDRPWLE